MTTKIETIQDIYRAFGQGDVASVVRAFTPEGEIRFNAARPTAPWQTTVKGRENIPTFFGALASGVEFSAFEPEELVEGPNAVIARVHMRFTVRATGREVEQRQVHWWAFAGSMVSSIVHYEDTAEVAAAVAR
jgi:ketosteroid isomerase-like protein